LHRPPRPTLFPYTTLFRSWDAVLRRFRTELRRLAGSDGGKPRFAEWFPKDTAPEDPAAKSPDLPAAGKFVAAAKGLSAEQVEAIDRKSTRLNSSHDQISYA